MKNNSNKYLVFLSLIFLLNILSACSSRDAKNSFEEDPDNKVLTTANSNTSKDGFSSFNESVEKKITISHRCTACGRCSLFDPEHFMDMGRGSMPKIISQDNLESLNLQKAIKACPANAIVLN